MLLSVTLVMGFIRYLILMQEMNHGRSHPLGTCVLLEVPSIQSLVQYFRAILSIADNFELKGMQISTYEITTANSVRAERNCSCEQCCAVFPYVNY